MAEVNAYNRLHISEPRCRGSPISLTGSRRAVPATERPQGITPKRPSVVCDKVRPLDSGTQARGPRELFKMSTSNSVSKLTKGLATTPIVAGFSAMIYVFVIQTRYLQPAYLTPHPESGPTRKRKVLT
jgi:hypothetical protein